MSGSNVSVTTFLGEDDGDIAVMLRSSDKRVTSLQMIVSGSKAKDVTLGTLGCCEFACDLFLGWLDYLWRHNYLPSMELPGWV
jgi:hypothetical protein|tara:strand:- start:492 stop:740 length:249 start_codon:yes stop_codon:yes gene_type:complete